MATILTISARINWSNFVRFKQNLDSTSVNAILGAWPLCPPPKSAHDNIQQGNGSLYIAIK